MEMDKESIDLCKRLEQSQTGIREDVGKMQNLVATVLHLLRGNELDDETGMISQMKQLRLEIMINGKKEDENKKVVMEKIAQDKYTIENKIELVKLHFEERLSKVEKWKERVVAMAIGVGVGAGFGIKSLIDYLSK